MSLFDEHEKKILREAADWLAENDWCQGTLFQTEGDETISACAMGAMQKASVQLFDHVGPSRIRALEDAQTRLSRYLQKEGIWTEGDDYMYDGGSLLMHPVAVWNDRTTTTKEDVILAMKSAAEENL